MGIIFSCGLCLWDSVKINYRSHIHRNEGTALMNSFWKIVEVYCTAQ